MTGFYGAVRALLAAACIWFIARLFTGSLAEGTVLYPAALTAGPLVVGLIAISIASRLPPWVLWAAVGGSLLSGVMGLWMEWSRWLPVLGLPGYTPFFIARNLDWPLILTALACLALPPLLLLRLAGGSGLLPRKRSTTFGSARWLSLREALRLFGKGELVIGEAYDAARLFPRPGTAPLLRFDGSEHLLTVGGAGTGKTSSLAVPNCLTWTGPLVALDPKGELVQKCRAAREAMGHDVLEINPRAGGDSINVLDWLDPSTDRVVEHVAAVISWLVDGRDPNGDNAVFERESRTLLEMLLLDIVCDPALPPERKTMAELAARIGDSDQAGLLLALAEKPPSYGWGVPQPIAGRFRSMLIEAPETWQGVLIHAAATLDWLKAPSLARLVCGGAGKTRPVRDLLSGNLDVFLCIPLRTLDSTPAVARLLLGALLNTVYDSYERTGGVTRRVLFLLDEMPRLRRMELLQTARDAGRGLGVTLWAIVQDLGQLKQAYGEDGMVGWIESTRIRTFMGVSHPETAKLVSDMLGQATVATVSTSTNRNGAGLWSAPTRGRGTNYAEAGHPLMTPDEVTRMALDEEGRVNEQLILVRGQFPLRCGVAVYWRRPDMNGKVAEVSGV